MHSAVAPPFVCFSNKGVINFLNVEPSVLGFFVKTKDFPTNGENNSTSSSLERTEDFKIGGFDSFINNLFYVQI